MRIWMLNSFVMVSAGCILTLFAGCQNQLPTAPSELARGIVVYEHANFLGASAYITSDISDLRTFKGPCVSFHMVSTSPPITDFNESWNDCISSVRVAPGWNATLYRDDGFRDDSITIAADVANLTTVGHDCPEKGLNDCVTSIRIRSR